MFDNLLSLRSTFDTKHYTCNDFCLCPRVLANMEEGHRKATEEIDGFNEQGKLLGRRHTELKKSAGTNPLCSAFSLSVKAVTGAQSWV